MTSDSPEPEDLLRLAERITDEIAVDWDGEFGRRPEHAKLLKQLESVERLSRFRREHPVAAPGRPAPALFTWGPLRALEKLGEGSYGEVYRAFEPTLHREVALKLRRGSSEASARPWLDEARRLARVRHAHVVHVYGAEVHDGRAGLWMELIHGMTLADWLERHGRLGAREAGHIALDLCGALAAVHAAGLVHGDVKASNVMREEGGRIVLMDFGAGGVVPPGETSARVSAATPAVAAPEVLAGDRARFSSDVFSLAALMYRMVTGQYPGGGAREAVGPALADLRPDLPRTFLETVERALEPDPERRTPTAGALASSLARALQLEPPGASPAGGTPGAQARDGAAAAAREAPSAASVAVLPFVSRTGDEEDGYFADGLADELLNVLGKIRGLRVAARTSSFQFRDTRDDLATIGRKLRVATLLEGSVRRSGTRLRIAVQLVSVADGYHLWSETYDRTSDDLFELQDDIARSVVKELRATLLGENADTGAERLARADVARASVGRGSDAEAHRLYLLARHFLERYSRDDTERAIAYLEQALVRDERFALAWAALGGMYSRRANRGWVPVAEGYAHARAAVQRAIALAPDLAEAHAAMGWIQALYDWDWRGAETSYDRALELSPGNPVALRGAGTLALALGNLPRAIELQQRAADHDPLSSASHHNLGNALFAADRLADAEAAYLRALELAPRKPGARAYLAMALSAAGRHEEALAEAGRESVEPLRQLAQVVVLAAMDRRAEAEERLADLVRDHAADCACQIAEAQSALGHADAAFEWLDRARELRDAGITDVLASQRHRVLHADPRWRAFLARAGLVS